MKQQTEEASRKKKRRRMNAGESIGETLVALLIGALGMLMLAQMVSASSDMILTSNASMKRYYDANNAVNAQNVEAQDGVATLSENGAAEPLLSQSVKIYEQATLGGKSVLTYQKAEP